MSDISRKDMLSVIESSIKSSKSESNIAVLWDVENVLPSKDSLFTEGLVEYLESFGRITIAKAYGNWNNNNVKHLIDDLSGNHFQLIYTPAARKNSSDMVMITDGMEIALTYDYIDLFVLLTGDIDFRPFMSSIRRNGKRVHIICDVKKASEDLLMIADEFVDYREMLPGGDDDEEDQSIPKSSSKGDTLAIWFSRMVEIIQLLEEEGKDPFLSIVKIKLKMLYPDFDETLFGFNKWSQFIKVAIEEEYVTLLEGKGGGKLQVSETKIQKQPEYIPILIESLAKLGGKKKWIHFSQISQALRSKGIAPSSYGFKQFKQLFRSAENRNIVKTKAEGLQHMIMLDQENQ